MEDYAYNNWIAVVFSIALFSFFVISLLSPLKKREWRTVGIFEAFIIALFIEMYGFPLTIYILSSFLGIPLSFGHKEGHLFAMALDRIGIMNLEAGWMLVMVLSTLLIGIGTILLVAGWRRIYRGDGKLVTSGLYRYIRHPQYLGLIIIIIGFLIQWPTIITVAMFPFLIVMYYRLAKKEEKELESEYGEECAEYRRRVPMFLPRIRGANSAFRGVGTK